MLKVQHVIRAPKRAETASFADWALGALGPELLESDVRGLHLTLTTAAPPRFSVVPYRRRPLALVSAWLDDDDASVDDWSVAVSDASRDRGKLEGWIVDESVPVESLRTWPEGTRTPGVGLLTLFRRKPGLDDEEFIRRWHHGHTPLTLGLHPVWRYVRNVTNDAVAPDSSDIEGIVEEHFRDRADLLKPTLLFGGPWAERRPLPLVAARMIPNMIRTVVDVSGFIDMLTIETYLVDEFRLRSLD